MSTTTERTPDKILADFDAGCMGTADVDMRGVLWEIINDILDSIELAEAEARFVSDESPHYRGVHSTVQDYVINHYGD